MTDMIMGSVLDGADDLLSSENCGSESIRKKQKTRRRSIAKCDPGSDDEAPEGEVMPSVGILQNADPEIHRETMAPAVGFEPTTNRLIPTKSELYHFVTPSIRAVAFELSAPISMP